MAKESSQTRTDLRTKTLGRARTLRKKMINYYPAVYREVKDDAGDVVSYEYLEDETYDQEPVKVEVRQPTVKERNKLINSCRDPETGRIDEMEFILQAAIAFTYDPESGEKLFDRTDYDALSESPAGDFVDQFGGEAIQMLTLGEAKTDSRKSLETM